METPKKLTLKDGETVKVTDNFVYITQNETTIVLTHEDWRKINAWIYVNAYIEDKALYR